MAGCDKEPCKSLIDRYWAAAISGTHAANMVRAMCDAWKAGVQAFWMLFALWVAVFVQAAACAGLHYPEWLCSGLTAASFVLLAALAGWGLRLAWLRRVLRLQQEVCRLRVSEMLSARRGIAVQCRECMPERVEVGCGC